MPGVLILFVLNSMFLKRLEFALKPFGIALKPRQTPLPLAHAAALAVARDGADAEDAADAEDEGDGQACQGRVEPFFVSSTEPFTVGERLEHFKNMKAAFCDFSIAKICGMLASLFSTEWSEPSEPELPLNRRNCKWIAATRQAFQFKLRRTKSPPNAAPNTGALSFSRVVVTALRPRRRAGARRPLRGRSKAGHG